MECIVTKLRAIINDNSLEGLDYITFNMRTNKPCPLRVFNKISGAKVVSANHEKCFYTSSNTELTDTLTLNSSGAYFNYDGWVKIRIYKPESVTKVEIWPDNTVDVEIEGLELTSITSSGTISMVFSVKKETTNPIKGDMFEALSNITSCENFIVPAGRYTYGIRHDFSQCKFSGKILSWDYTSTVNITVDGIDDFLNDFQYAERTNSDVSPQLRISYGSRTSASDNAISVLQSKGFTVIVPQSTSTMSEIGGADTTIMRIASFVQPRYAVLEKQNGEIISGVIDLSSVEVYPAFDINVRYFDNIEEAKLVIQMKFG